MQRPFVWRVLNTEGRRKEEKERRREREDRMRKLKMVLNQKH